MGIANNERRIRVRAFTFNIQLSLSNVMGIIGSLSNSTIYVFIVIARRENAIRCRLSRNFLSFRINVNDVSSLLRVRFAFFRCVFFRGKRTINGDARANTLGVTYIVAQSTIVVVFSFNSAIVGRRERRDNKDMFNRRAIGMITSTCFRVCGVVSLFGGYIVGYFVAPRNAKVSYCRTCFLT